MNIRFTKLLDHIIWFSFLIVAILTPLIFSTSNTELYEVPKMLFVYFWATIILFATLLKFVASRKIALPKSWPLALFGFFVLVQVVSTFTSIDKFTSIFGFPSRLNGGLVSQFAYLAIFGCALINLSLAKAQKLITALVISAFIVSLWGIPGHFGFDPSCYVLTSKFDSSCWQTEFDPRLRIFSTLGQPNWLASYLILILPLSLATTLSQRKPQIKILFGLITATLFWAIILTNSRSGFAGIGIALAVFAAALGPKFIKNKAKILGPLAASFIILTLIFGNALVARITESVRPYHPAANPQESTQSAENLQRAASLPTESGKIRLIVWQGAVEIFKKWPITGSGPETFAYSYYQKRPIAHNATSEWNFFYNKAHNEFLNFLSNTGITGLLAYLALLGSIIFALLKNGSINAKAQVAAILGYLTSIFFGFSTVTSSLVLFLACACVLKENQEIKTVSRAFLRINLKLITAIRIVLLIIIMVLGLWTTINVLRLYLADIAFQKAQELDPLESQGLIYNVSAINLFPATNPFYLAQYSLTSSILAENLEDKEMAKFFLEHAKIGAQEAQAFSQNNLLIIRKIATSYLHASSIEPELGQKALEAGTKLTKLAPNDPQSYVTLARIQIVFGKTAEARKSLEFALVLKPDYQEARQLLEQIQGKKLQ